MRSLNLNCNGDRVGYLFDDDDINNDTHRMCPAVEFSKINGNSVVNDYSENTFYNDISDVSAGSDCLAMTTTVMNRLVE